ncbi:class I SAM-dependent methyltransferase [Kangiella sp. TOML190]|uniref:class I SAM-dependent methyltransferase n=1 Tax=Kangiella sp. TOML190 TaxID=2931351 RepID=UPI00203B88DD|nr:class I SAM-dependent methyltransferase [Kangiella sp. TOML190]
MPLKRSVSVCNSLGLPSPELVEFAPFLYQDIQEILTNTDAMISLINNNLVAMDNCRVLDLCCAKGTSLLRIAKRFSISGIGVDLSEFFIADAKLTAVQHKLKQQLKFVCQDANQFLSSNQEQFDIIIFQFVEDLIGSFPDTLKALATHLKPNGHLIIDTHYESQGYTPGVAATDASGAKSIELYIAESELVSKSRIGESRDEIEKRMGKEYNLLSKRAHELQKQHPELEQDINQFLLSHRKLQRQLLAGDIYHATWLLAKI